MIWTPFVSTVSPMAAAKRGRPKKQARARKSDRLQIRVTDEQKEILRAAAERSGISISSWIVSMALARAKEDAR